MPTSVVRCVNTKCPLRGEPRTVDLAEVGDGLHALPTIVCSCGCAVVTQDRWGQDRRPTPDDRPPVADPHPKTEKTVRKGAPEKRGR